MSKIILISDIHFGARNNNIDIFNNQIDYFNNFFLPLVNQDDILFILGDIFENRNSVNVFILHNTINNIFRKLSESFKEIHILIGNHDMYFKDHNLVTPVDLLKYDNIKIYKEPTHITINNQDYLFVPYYEDKLIEKEIMHKYRNKNTICLMHADIAGFYYNKTIMVDSNSGNDISVYSGYKHIYSGHFHIRQSNNNITYIGCPYHLDKNDIGNKKGIYYIEDNVVNFIPNDYSPEYIKIAYTDMLTTNSEDIHKLVNNNYVDIIVDSNDMNNTIYDIVKLYKSARDIKLNILERENDCEIVYEETSKFDIIDLYVSYITQMYNIIDTNEYVNYINDKYNARKMK